MTELILYKNKKIEDKIDYYIQNIDIYYRVQCFLKLM